MAGRCMIKSWCCNRCTILLPLPWLIPLQRMAGTRLSLGWDAIDRLLIGDGTKHLKGVVFWLKPTLLWISYAKDKKLFKIASMIIHDYSFAAVLVFPWQRRWDHLNKGLGGRMGGWRFCTSKGVGWHSPFALGTGCTLLDQRPHPRPSAGPAPAMPSRGCAVPAGTVNSSLLVLFTCLFYLLAST